MKYLINQTISAEWDDNKNKQNIKRHSLSFETAALVFVDDFRLEFFDNNHSDEEERYITIGNVGEIIIVVYTLRGKSYRLISARLATKTERQIYYGNRKNYC
ncbi:MAG: BrnT family toxin [Firmicutes bacterium]|nr:BrnT family toxin [Bacillota bacterium]